MMRFLVPLIAFLLIAARAPSPGPKPLYKGVPEAGKFLVATRQITDGIFRETVILLIKHDRHGTMGVIVNRPTKARLSRFFPGLEKSEEPMYFGGPVDGHLAQFLIRSAKKPVDAEHVFGDVYVSATPSVLERMAKGASREKVRVYAGYAGWAPGQLQMEMGRGDWVVVGADADSIFEKDPSTVWDELISEGTRIRI